MCAVCHTFDKGGPTRVGPNLYGIAGEQIAAVPGFNFSSALKGHKGTWTEQNLNDWLKNPDAFASGTYMTFPGIPSDSQRNDVVAYLESLQDGTSKDQAKRRSGGGERRAEVGPYRAASSRRVRAPAALPAVPDSNAAAPASATA
jgi:cytochrome c